MCVGVLIINIGIFLVSLFPSRIWRVGSNSTYYVYVCVCAQAGLLATLSDAAVSFTIFAPLDIVSCDPI